jgi:4-diphosphocytidyl-2-C-methyl-D-erythritol kinase
MSLTKRSPCKVNLLLNILKRRADGFHELESVMYPIRIYDEISFASTSKGIELTCSDPNLPTDSGNLVYRAAALFLDRANIGEGARLHLEKRIPLAAGLGGGSGNAATALVGLNELFGQPLGVEQLSVLASSLGSDVPFFLQDKPALATGRGEQIHSLDFFPVLRGTAFLLVHPRFGISSAWAYQQLKRFPEAVGGRPGRAQELISLLQGQNLKAAGSRFYNALELPALEKYPLLAIFQDFFREQGAAGTLMSGSGSTTFAFLESQAAAENLLEKFQGKFGNSNWTAIVPA